MHALPHLIVTFGNRLAQLGMTARLSVGQDLVLPQVAALVIGQGKHLLHGEWLAVGVAQLSLRRELVLKTRARDQ